MEPPVIEDQSPELRARLRQRLEKGQRSLVSQRFGRLLGGAVQGQVDFAEPLEPTGEKDQMGASQRQFAVELQPAVVQFQKGQPVGTDLVESFLGHERHQVIEHNGAEQCGREFAALVLERDADEGRGEGQLPEAARLHGVRQRLESVLFLQAEGPAAHAQRLQTVVPAQRPADELESRVVDNHVIGADVEELEGLVFGQREADGKDFLETGQAFQSE